MSVSRFVDQSSFGSWQPNTRVMSDQATLPGSTQHDEALEITSTTIDRRSCGIGNASWRQYIKLNVGGSLFVTSLATLTRQESMLSAMFSGRMDVVSDSEGYVIIDRSGRHFGTILNYLRDGTATLPKEPGEIAELMQEAKYYCLTDLVEMCRHELDTRVDRVLSINVCRVPIITNYSQEYALITAATLPAVKLLLNRHNNKYSYTNQSDDNLLKNQELFDKLVLRFSNRILFIKDVGSADEVCSWSFYGSGKKVAEVCCTSIVYAPDRKHTKVEFPEARIYEEAMNTLLYEWSNNQSASSSHRKSSGTVRGAQSPSNMQAIMPSTSNQQFEHSESIDQALRGSSEPSSPTPGEQPARDDGERAAQAINRLAVARRELRDK